MEKLKKKKQSGIPIGDGQKSNLDTMVDQLMEEETIRQNKKNKPFKKGANASPTKRLIAMKDASSKQKKALARKSLGHFHAGQENPEYQLTYQCGVNKAYVVKPQHEIDYDLADRNPKKFMESVYNQEIHQVEVSDDNDGESLSPRSRRKLRIRQTTSKRIGVNDEDN